MPAVRHERAMRASARVHDAGTSADLDCCVLFSPQAVRLESTYQNRTRYMVVVSTNGRQDTEESIVLGMDFSSNDRYLAHRGRKGPLLNGAWYRPVWRAAVRTPPGLGQTASGFRPVHQPPDPPLAL